MKRPPAGTIPAIIVLAAVGVSVGFPAVRVAVDAAAGLWRDGWGAVPAADAPLALRSLVAAGLVAVLATVLALPAAWAARGLSARWTPLLALPLLLPSYLAYSSLNLLRAPGTPLGDWLLSAPLDAPNLRPVIAARVIAVLGLALWAWPLPALVMFPRFRRIDRGVLELLRLEPLSPSRRTLFLLRMAAGPIAAAAGLTMLVMLGSAVPFHLAQLDTYAVGLWRALDEAGPSRHWIAWAAAWPMLAIALAAALALVRLLPTAPVDSAQAPAEGAASRVPRTPAALAAALWGASVLLPLILFARGVGGSGPLLTFWRSRGDALADSLLTSAALFATAALIAGATAAALASPALWPRRLATTALAGWLVAGLLPGVLVGSATAAAWNRHGWTYALAESPAIVVAAHLARFGFLAALLGWWMHRTDPRDERELRALDGADRGLPWTRAAALPQLPLLVGGSLAIAVLGFHEIEAAVFVQPPGHGRFAQVVLELLHYERRADLAAAVVTVTGLGLVAALAAALTTATAARWASAARTRTPRL